MFRTLDWDEIKEELENFRENMGKYGNLLQFLVCNTQTQLSFHGLSFKTLIINTFGRFGLLGYSFMPSLLKPTF